MSDVQAGDRITVGVTHQIEIDGKDAWIKAEFNSAAQEGETDSEAFKRVGKVVARNIVSIIERQAEVIVEANAAQK